jgi:citrate lyase beta subunit
VGGSSPIAQTLDRDFGFVTRYSVNPRAARHAAMNLKPQSLGGCLAMDWNDNVDEIGHADRTLADSVRRFRAKIASAAAAAGYDAITPGGR